MYCLWQWMVVGCGYGGGGVGQWEEMGGEATLYFSVMVKILMILR